MWLQLAKEFPNFNKEEILLSFLEMPTNNQMNSSIFNNG